MSREPGWFVDPWGEAPCRWFDGSLWIPAVNGQTSSSAPGQVPPTAVSDAWVNASAAGPAAESVAADVVAAAEPNAPSTTAKAQPASVPEPPAVTSGSEADAQEAAAADRERDGLTITAEFQSALDHLRAGRHLFLTGKAGTGKSTLIRLHTESTPRRTITVAPTGIAALNVDGYTIHRLFSFPKGVTVDHVRSDKYRPNRFAKALSSLDTLIVDEVSMVRADLFDAIVAALERFGPKPGTPFGGVQLVLVGDLYQLPPVVSEAEAEWIDQRFGTPYFFSAHSFDRETFPTVELGTVFRQQGDGRLVELLNAVRNGAMLDAARAELNARTDPDFEPPVDEFWLTLAGTNRIVAARNRQMLERLPSPAVIFTATITGDTDGYEFPTDSELDIAVGAQVMMLNNDPADRWVNGTLGRITSIRADDRGGPLIEVLFRDGRTEYVGEHMWEISRPQIQGGALVHEVVGTFTQLPMKLAWAITIHKSQGQTLDRLVVDLTGGTFANGQLYVALSRCTSLDGLVLKREVSPKDLKTDIRIRRYLDTGAAAAASIGEAYLAVLTVGSSGMQWRPRPVEIAVVTDDGDEVTTVINPTSDLYNAREDYGLTTRDVQLAPLLTEAWPALAPVLAGRIPVGIDIDEQLGYLDFELKRNEIVQPISLGVDVPDHLLTAGERADITGARTALERARPLRAAVQRIRGGSPERLGSGTPFPQSARGQGYLLARTTGPAGTSAPTGFVVGGHIGVSDDPAGILAELLAGAWARIPNPDDTTVERVREAERYFGVSVLPEGFQSAEPLDIDELLCPGAGICFTGEVSSSTHGALTKEDLHALADRRGLVPEDSLTKSRTDVLVVAEAGTQSGKAKKAARWNKPVITAADFLDWAHRR
ncbi:MAG: AAA family ATPase [Gordonia sp. (in: high G+C Gram-positive bacteria)]|uniref:AAA family ATPase n=1 Tax=Gordonia sp. (in: high G+C Gram-positive bacteria) TaxID=84139 RepID=UPI003BB65B43